MMLTVNIHEAKTNLSKLIAAAVAGEPFVIAKAGKPLVKVERIQEAGPATKHGKRRLGFMRGMYTVPDDFNTMGQAEIEEALYENLDKLE